MVNRLKANGTVNEYAMSYREIALELGISEKTAKWYARMAFTKLRKHPELFKELRALVILRREERRNYGER